MSCETSKCQAWRKQQGHFEKFLHGRGIDIGCGPDCLKIDDGTVVPWDQSEGDAQYMSSVVDEQFDFVYSSHCLEHLVDVPTALRNWNRILKPTGFLYLVVPDYLLYEKFTWPSIYAGGDPHGHKHTFSMFNPSRTRVGRNNHWTFIDDMPPLLGVILHVIVQDDGFDYSKGREDQTLGSAMAQICCISHKKTD